MHASSFTTARTAALSSSRCQAIAACTALMAISSAHRFRRVINAVSFGDLKLSQPESKSDLADRSIPFFLLWGGPILVLLSLNFFRLPLAWVTMIMSASFAWMGIGCAINAHRCHRQHCYYASPILLVGAVLTVLVGFTIIDLGAYGLTYISWGTFASVLLTFVPEKISGKYKS